MKFVIIIVVLSYLGIAMVAVFLLAFIVKSIKHFIIYLITPSTKQELGPECIDHHHKIVYAFLTEMFFIAIVFFNPSKHYELNINIRRLAKKNIVIIETLFLLRMFSRMRDYLFHQTFWLPLGLSCTSTYLQKVLIILPYYALIFFRCFIYCKIAYRFRHFLLTKQHPDPLGLLTFSLWFWRMDLYTHNNFKQMEEKISDITQQLDKLKKEYACEFVNAYHC